ncbi:MAG: HEAT repeat domain-containing protein [Phycisphaerales bacterium]
MKTHSHIPGSGRSLLTGVLVILFVAATLWAHGDNVPQVIVIPSTPSTADQVKPVRWSWLHWWETNRELYLRPPLQGEHRQDIDAARFAALRAEASAELLKALNDEAVEPRLAAALALGRLGAPPAEGVLEKLQERAGNDPSEQVRLHAVLAIGLIGGEVGEQALRSYQPETQRLRAAALIATGLLSSPNRATLDGLNTLLDDPSPSIRGAALSALAQQVGRIDTATLVKQIRRDPSPWLVSRSELTLGGSADETGVQLLIHILADEDQAVQSPLAWGLLESVRSEKNKAIGRGSYKSWTEAHRRLFEQDPAALGDPADLMRDQINDPDAGTAGESSPRSARRQAMVLGIEEIYRSRLRSSAAIALGDVGPRPGVVQALQGVLHERDDDYNTAPKCFALISLGRIGAHEGLADLLDVLNDRGGRQLKPQKVLESPQRGFAAISLGLYARPYQSVQGVSDRPEYEKAIEMLQARLTDKREKVEVRAACAVALGLAGRTVSLKTLIGEYQAFDETNPLLGGYVLLARAMLGDRNLIGPVSQAMARKPDRDEMTDLLARRAAVLALGVSGAGEAIPHLIRFWDESYHVNREVILALSLCGTEGVSIHVIPQINRPDDHLERAYFAEVTGRMLERGAPPILSRCLIGSNFTMKDAQLEPYYTLSNQFLYNYLIPMAEVPWY